MGGYFNGGGMIPRNLRNPRFGRSFCNFTLAGLLLLLASASVAAAAQFLRPEANYVLVTGLPGDLESESTYRDQLQTWLEILQGIRPKQIIALTDNPESVSLGVSATANSSITFLPSSRSNFLAVSSLITASTNPLVVVVWGHGGKQGNTPVFHVRGPRITSADLSAFADKTGLLESRWILCFRGSGFFAGKLAGSRRQILSSESDTMFNSDPVEMSLMLKIARETATNSFEILAENLGRTTAEWYKERNLARTEEPTLWLENQKPRLLAASSEESALASVDPNSTKSAIKATNELPKTIAGSNTVGEISAADLPAAWKELKRVDARDYPDADAIMLRRRINYTLAASPALVAEHDEFIQILTAEGKRFGDFDISYAPPFEDISFSDCEVLSPQGKLARLNPDAIREANDESLGDYQAGRRKFFSLPGVVPGAILHVHYHNEWKKFPLPHVCLEIPVSGELSALESTLQVSVPKDEPFHFALENVSDSITIQGSSINPDPAIKQTSYGATYIWQFTNLVGESREILAPPRQGIALLVSTFSDWSDFAEWYARISKLTDEVTPEIKAKAAELTRELKTDREKILSVYNYVTSLRYVAIPLGVNSFRPHAAANVFKNQFGDCKDKANLFNTMLRSLNIDAHLVLVPRFRQAYDALPGLAFNHAISRVTLSDETLWVDTTDDVCRFGMLPPGDSGRKVLVIAEQTNSLTQLPAPEATRHKLTVRGEIDCTHGFNELPTSFEVAAFGYPDYELRESARAAKEHAGAVPFLSARYRLSGGSFALEKQIATPVAALDRDFAWRAKGSLIGSVSKLPDDSTNSNRASLRPSFWLPKEWDLALNQRKSALFLNQGYPLTLDEQLEFTLPSRSQVARLPGPAANTRGPLKWKLEWTKPNDARLQATLRAELSTGELSVGETSALQQQLRALISAVNAGITFEVRSP
jgi:Domain of Unknown Function with PDB structure (DUF3857)/Transglutaminase-like superfamily